MADKNDSIYLFLLEQMFNNSGSERTNFILPRTAIQNQENKLTTKTKTSKIIQEQSTQSSIEKKLNISSANDLAAEIESIALLRKLTEEESELLKEKHELSKTQQELNKDIIKQIENREHKVAQYKAKIMDLKKKCQIMLIALRTESLK